MQVLLLVVTRVSRATLQSHTVEHQLRCPSTEMSQLILKKKRSVSDEKNILVVESNLNYPLKARILNCEWD